MIIGRTARTQLSIYLETGCVMTCYSYHTEILDPQDAKCLCNKEFIVLEKCRVLFTGEIHLNKENFPLIWTILSELFNFRFEIDMATLNNAFQNQR